MAPPTKYKTDAAKLQAMRAKRSRYYAKRSLQREERNTTSTKNRRKDDDSSDNKGAGDNLDKGNDGSDVCEAMTMNQYECIAVVKYAKDDFMAHIKSPQIFTLGVLAEYTKSIPDAPGTHGDREILKRAMSSIEDFLDRASRGQDGILQLCGVCDEWRAAEQVCRSMRDTIAMVEDIYCHALSDGDAELAVVHLLKGFLYQNYNEF
ncbi:hypothetical protein DEU56DRAFT_912518 [Suillus clintonianus]|uniref:uncharacterized protein n=1 Tax=Suillus clintonianus TaxID=1904413 RepID=UPI001B872C17|nr:uncharacterized protein DEU56DRAFT_912518 [Suillus clintonianus]KAG2138356.1 hypothetical protein DEU56DRAFT_912518 [Suillus clintonianus]